MKQRVMISFISIMLFAGVIAAQQRSAAQDADNLRGDLFELQVKEETVRLRLTELEDELKPENIERALAGIGSTKPEELREQRRRRLTIEKESLLAQLEVLQKTRSRLELELVTAQTRAYHESAAPKPSPMDHAFVSGAVIPPMPMLATIGVSLFLFGFGAIMFLSFLRRPRRMS